MRNLCAQIASIEPWQCSERCSECTENIFISALFDRRCKTKSKYLWVDNFEPHELIEFGITFSCKTFYRLTVVLAVRERSHVHRRAHTRATRCSKKNRINHTKQFAQMWKLAHIDFNSVVAVSRVICYFLVFGRIKCVHEFNLLTRHLLFFFFFRWALPIVAIKKRIWTPKWNAN